MGDRLSRRDRAALTLCLEVLRGGAGRAPEFQTLGLGALAHSPLGLSIGRAVLETRVGSDPARTARLLRARLALLLRAVLRADAGDWFGTRCDACDYNGRTGRIVAWPFKTFAVKRGERWTYARCDRCDDDRWLRDMRITPLWEKAKPHG